MALNDCYVMRGHLIGNPNNDGYIHWTSLNTPDYAGVYSGYSPGSLEDVEIDYKTKVPVLQNNAGSTAALSFPETTLPPTPLPNQGLIYYDAISKKFFISENGAGFVPLLNPGGGGGAAESGNYPFIPGNVDVGDVVYLTNADVIERASAVNQFTQPVLGIVTSLLYSPAPIATVQYGGELTLAGTFVNLIIGAQYYLSNVSPGKIMSDISGLTSNNVLQKVGKAKDQNTLIIDIDQDIIVLA